MVRSSMEHDRNLACGCAASKVFPAASNMSTPASTLKPAISNPVESPPAPQNRSTAVCFIVLLVLFLFQINGSFSFRQSECS